MAEVEAPQDKQSWIDERGNRLKVEKNTKGYNWTVALVPNEGEAGDDLKLHNRLVVANLRMARDFGQGQERWEATQLLREKGYAE